jgi:glycogen synthase
MFVFNAFRHDTRVLKQALTLAGAGHDVRVVAALEPGTAREETVEGIRVRRAQRRPRRGSTALARLGVPVPAPAGDGSEEVVGPVPAFAAGTASSRGVAAAARRLVARVYRQRVHARFRRNALALALSEPADVFVAHDLDTLEVAERARRRRGGGLVYDSHELFVERSVQPALTALGRRRWRRVERRLIRRADRVTTVCPPIADELARRYGVPRPAVVLNAPPFEGAEGPSPLLRELTGVEGPTRIAIYVGGIQYSRPLDVIVEAAEHLEDCVLVVIGPVVGSAAASLRALAAERGLEGRVLVLPPVPQADVVALASGADVGIVPLAPVCLNHVYALPNKLFQYLMAGLPVAASPMAELTRVVEEHDVGAIFAANEPRAIAATINAILADPARAAEMRANARAAARELCWERQAPAVLAAVEDAYARRRAPRRLVPSPRSAAAGRSA